MQHPFPVSFSSCSGWLHPAAGGRGVVLCAAYDYEGFCANQSWRALADMIADAGLPVLQFDYPGAGNSLGLADDTGRIEAQAASIVEAVRFLKRATGVTEVALVGLRLGATLAVRALKECPETKQVALLAPISSGKAYVRELRAMSAMLAQTLRIPADPGVDVIDVGGFRTPPETIAALASLKLELKEIDRPLFLSLEPGRAAPEDLAKNAAVAAFEGYGAMMAPPTVAAVPREDWRALVDWLKRDAPAGAFPARVEAAPLSCDVFEELGVRFGLDDDLAGVLCKPKRPGSRCAVLFLNSGTNSRIGWARSSVAYARELAREGIGSLRFDLVGIGNSRPLEGGSLAALYDLARIADVSAAIDRLAVEGFDQVVLVGQCSGAYLALQAARVDARVDHAILVNLSRFIWENESLESAMNENYRSSDAYLDEMRRGGGGWRRLLRGDVNWRRVPGVVRTIGKRALRDAAEKAERFSARALGLRRRPDVVETWLRALAARGAKVSFVFSDGDGGRDLYAAHLGRNGWRIEDVSGIDVHVVVGADHDLTPRSAQAALYQKILAAARETPSAKASDQAIRRVRHADTSLVDAKP